MDIYHVKESLFIVHPQQMTILTVFNRVLPDTKYIIGRIIVSYMIESIAQLREKRNELRLKRFLPSKTRRRNGKRLASYELPWRSVTN